MEELVKYQNDMNKLSFKNFNSMDINIFMVLCSQVKEKGTNEIMLSFSQIKELAHYEKKSSIEEFKLTLKLMNRKLMNVNCEIITDDEESMFVLFPTFTIKPKEELLIIAVNEKFVWLLNEMKSYTVFELTEFVQLKSKYSKHLYRLLKQWRNKGTYTFHDLEQFRQLMDIPTSYPNKYMMNECVNVAVEEISKLDKSFTNFKCEPKYASKRGRPLEKLIFTWDIHTNQQIDGQTNFSDTQTFEEYMKGYQGADKPTSIDIKIAKDIQKGRERKKNTSVQPKKNAFNNFEQRTYDNGELERMLFGSPIEEKLVEQAVAKSEPKEKGTSRTSKEALVQEYILAHQNESVSQIAKNLGISRTTVYKYMTKKS